MTVQPPVFVALDVDSASKAQAIVAELGAACGHYKVGLELYLATGAGFVEELVTAGKQVFLDLKFHDIPNTVNAAVREAARLGVEFMTVHALGGSAMLQAAVAGARAGSRPDKDVPKVLAVTLLTSHAPEDLLAIGLGNADPEFGALRLARLAEAAGVHGVVCSPNEVAKIKSETRLAAMVPGIRPTDSERNDHSRAATPAEAVKRGANYLVVGRPIVQAADPLRTLLAIQEEIRLAY